MGHDHVVVAPQGIDALYRRPSTPLKPLVGGAGQEHGLRPGTENVAGIVGLGVACDLARAQLATENERLAGLRNTLWELLNVAIPGMRRHTPSATLLALGVTPTTALGAVCLSLGHATISTAAAILSAAYALATAA